MPCQCDKDHECAYERTDMKMRVYRQVCVPRSNEFHETPQNFYD
uniref:NRXN1 n=1 Tax=Ascaris lumbricoides TaxID=6252 RepID=A0A0M3IHZ5_ASCLU